MRFGQKIAYFACGCVFVVAGQVVSGLVVLRATAQPDKKPSAEFEALIVRRLDVVDAYGRVRARLEVTPRGSILPVDDVLQVLNKAGVSVYRVGVGEHGGLVSVHGNDEMSGTMMGVGKDGGWVSVQGNNGKVRAMMDVVEHGGLVRVYGNEGKPRAGMGVDKDGGLVSVRGNNEMSGASMGVGKDGGLVHVYGNDSKPRAGMVVNEYGYGRVETWDKNGYKTGNLP